MAIWFSSTPALAQGNVPTVSAMASDAILAKHFTLKDKQVCNSKAARPLERWRELFFGRQRNMRCTDVVKSVQSLESQLGGKLYDHLATNEKAASIGFNYEKECLVKFAEVTDPNGGYKLNRDTANHLIHMSSTDEVDTVRSSVGSLSRLGLSNFCTASMVDIGGNQTGLLTAMHCLGFEKEVAGTDNRSLSAVFPEVLFQSMSGKKIRIKLDRDLEEIEYDRIYGDGVILKLGSFGADRHLSLASFSAILWEPLLVVGISPYLSRKPVKGVVSLKPSLDEITVVSLEPYCTLLSRDDRGGIRYGCQTEQGQSGSPIFVLRNQRFFVVGIHTGGSAVGPDQCSKDAVGAVNMGISIVSNGVQ